MVVPRSRARRIGAASIGLVLLVQAFNSFACYKHDIKGFLVVSSFLLVPLLPALVSLALANPLRATGACVCFVPWLLVAYYTDCVRPYTGGGASMVYVLVFMYGTLTSLIGALTTNLVTRKLGIQIAAG